MEKFLDQGNLLVFGKCTLSMKIYLTVKNKFSWLQTKMIAQTILKTNGSSESIKTYLLSLKQKISLLALIAVDKINIIFGRRLQLKY